MNYTRIDDSPIIYFDGEFYAGNKYDFCNFHFGGLSARDLGITRVSNGDRYDETLLPTVENKTVQVPGYHGSYFFGSYYRDKTFSIPIAYDDLSEAQLRNLITVFSPCNELQELWFDERPYIGYKVKVSAPISLSYICFDEGTNHRRYKGEGTISLQCFNPFGYDRFKYISEYRQEYRDKYYIKMSSAFSPTNPEYVSTVSYFEKEDDGTYTKTAYSDLVEGITYYKANSNSDKVEIRESELDDYINEWSEGSRLLTEQGNNNKFVNGVCSVYNAGDIETDFSVILKLSAIEGGDIYLWGSTSPWGNADLGNLVIKSVVSESYNDSYIRINSKLNVIEGLDYSKNPTGTIYNKYIESGDFFRIPVNTNRDDETDRTKLFLTSTQKGAFGLNNLHQVGDDELLEDKDYTLEIVTDPIENAELSFNYKYL